MHRKHISHTPTLGVSASTASTRQDMWEWLEAQPRLADSAGDDDLLGREVQLVVREGKAKERRTRTLYGRRWSQLIALAEDGIYLALDIQLALGASGVQLTASQVRGQAAQLVKCELERIVIEIRRAALANIEQLLKQRSRERSRLTEGRR